MPKPSNPQTQMPARSRGRALGVLLTLSMCSAAIFTLLVQDVARTIELGSVTWQSVFLWVLMTVMLAPVPALTGRARRDATLTVLPVLGSREELEDHTYVLYLRPFDEDRALFRTQPSSGRHTWSAWVRYFGEDGAQNGWTGEERLVHLFRRFGRVVAVGRPGEPFPLPGAGRFYLPKTDWKPEVSDAMRRARQVLLVAGITGDAKRA